MFFNIEISIQKIENLFNREKLEKEISKTELKKIENKLKDLICLLKRQEIKYEITRPIDKDGPLLLGGNLFVDKNKYEFLCLFTQGQWNILTLNPIDKNVEIITKFICYAEYNPLINSKLSSKIEFVKYL